MNQLHFLTSNNLRLSLTALPPLIDWLTAFWLRSFYLQRAPVTAEAAIAYRFLPDRHAVLANAALGPLVYHSDNLQVWQTEGGFHLRCGDSRLQVDLVTGSAVGWLAPSFAACALPEQRDFFLLSLLMLCHGRHCFAIHANGLCDPAGRTYLLVGNSGSGKTTLAMTCVRQGWRYLGDDVVLLDQPAAAIHAFALRRDFACSPPTIAHLQAQGALVQPGIAHSAARTDDAAKQVIDETAFFPAHAQAVMCPTMICFTAIRQQPQSQLNPMAQSQALVLLAQQSAGIMTDRTIAQQQLTLLKQLTTQAPGYTLTLGQDVFTDPTALPRLLQQEANRG